MEQLTLQTRNGTVTVPVQYNKTVVTIAKENKITWGYACERGNCAQCRTKVIKGAEYLNEMTPEEKLRLRKAERTEGYRLGCQIKVEKPGEIELAHKPY